VTFRNSLRIATSRLLHQSPFSSVSGRVAHLVGAPTLHEIYLRSGLWTASPAEAAAALVGEAEDHEQEYARVRDQIAEQSSRESRRYPDYYVVEDATAYLLYLLVRQAKPSLTIEVGVADGRSTQVLLSAMDANDSGRLISIDIDGDVGGGARGHPRWSLRVHSPGRSSSRELQNLLAEVGPPDLFFHDGSHIYCDQLAEYLAAWGSMRPGSLFISDDVDHSYAFMDLARTFGLKPVILTDRRKATGALVR
jgi:predicted O-methyltransferase YrrM